MCAPWYPHIQQPPGTVRTNRGAQREERAHQRTNRAVISTRVQTAQGSWGVGEGRGGRMEDVGKVSPCNLRVPVMFDSWRKWSRTFLRVTGLARRRLCA